MRTWMSMNRVAVRLNSNRRPIGPLCQIESTRKGHNVEVYKCAVQASNRSGCCSENLDVYDSAQKMAGTVVNTVASVRRAIASRIRSKQDTLIVCEGTGGYEHCLVDVAHEQGIPVAVANPSQVRDFAKGHGYLEKSDVIDASIICRFGQDVALHLTPPRSEQRKATPGFGASPNQLIQMINREQNRLAQTNDCVSRASIENMLLHLKNEQKEIDRRLEQLVTVHFKKDRRVSVLSSVPGVGIITVATLMAELPELGV